MPDVIVNKNGVFIDTHVRYRTISDNLSKQEYKFLLTTTLTISDFEGHKLYGTKNYDAFLKYVYNDYMTLPPKEKRFPHAPVSSFNFNVQSKSVDREKVK